MSTSNRDNNFFAEEGELEHNPEEAAIRMWLRVFVTIRWITILGIIAATLVASRIFNIEFPTISVYGVCAFVALCNLALLFQSRSIGKMQTGLVIQRARTFGTIHLLLDLAAFTVLLHFTGDYLIRDAYSRNIVSHIARHSC